MKALRIVIGITIAGLMQLNPCQGQVNDDIIIAGKAIRSLKRANVMNGITISLGVASNLEMLAIGGFPLEVDDGLNAGLNLTHMAFGVGRFTTSIFPPIHIAKARRLLQPWHDSPEMASSSKKLFATLNAAQVLSTAAPVLCFAGGIMMITASTSGYSYSDYNNNGYYEYR